ncbi:MAG: DUF4386 domain-containing protein [Anaerolineales bacterium]|nr:DUF4386 domain-containing protein [Anaerolineales bacterium]
MNLNRKTAIIVGVLYIIGTVAGIFSLVFTEPVRNSQDYLVYVFANENQVIAGALFVLTMGLALAMVPVVAFPVLRKYNEALALGYVVFRGGLETVIYMAMAVNWLLLLPLSQVYRQSTIPDVSNFQALGALLLDADELSSILVIVFILGALMFYAVLYQSRLVPRWLSGWGLIATIPYFAAGLLTMFALISPLSTTGVVLNLPLAVQEMVLAVWLIVKGFNPSAIAAVSVYAGTTEV